MVMGFVDLARRRSEELRHKVFDAFRHGVTALTLPPDDDRSEERHTIADAMRSAAELRELSRHEYEELRRDLRTDLEYERQIIDQAFHAVTDELATLSRRQSEELREALQVASERELTTLTLVTNAVAEVASLSRRQHQEMQEMLQKSADLQLLALAQVTDALKALTGLP